jgi:hypothetical protein
VPPPLASSPLPMAVALSSLSSSFPAILLLRC